MIDPASILNAKILIVDDTKANIRLLQRTLRDAGYGSVSFTMDPQKVAELYEKHHFDLILLDLEMPDMDGFQVLNSLQEIEFDDYLPVMVLTANPAHKLRALQSGAKDFISKPFDLAEVLMRVHNMLEVRLVHEVTRDHGLMLESIAGNDPLTGLGNRRLLAERMAMAISHARRKNCPMAVVYLDLDGFKQINDTHGHGAGDLLLKSVADRLRIMVREEDTLVRMGGDEFVIVLSDLERVDSADRVTTVARKALVAVALPYEIEENVLHVTTSAGIAIFPFHGEDADTLIKNADTAMYESKRAGRSVFRIFSPRDFAGVRPSAQVSNVAHATSSKSQCP